MQRQASYRNAANTPNLHFNMTTKINFLNIFLFFQNYSIFIIFTFLLQRNKNALYKFHTTIFENRHNGLLVQHVIISTE